MEPFTIYLSTGVNFFTLAQVFRIQTRRGYMMRLFKILVFFFSLLTHFYSQAAEIEVPSPFLMYKVAGTVDEAWFINSGKASLVDLEIALSTVGYNLTDFKKILDWGCGCGRITRHMSEIKNYAEIHGCDIDAEAINWSKTHIPFVNFSICDGLPPTLYPNNYFDFIFSHSVMTHLDENYQDAWLAELKRILKPGGVIILSTHGDTAISTWIDYLRANNINAEPYLNALDQRGMCFWKDDQWGGIFPDFYHSAFHRAWYIYQHWGKFFQVKSYLVQRGLGWQDYVVMMKE